VEVELFVVVDAGIWVFKEVVVEDTVVVIVTFRVVDVSGIVVVS